MLCWCQLQRTILFFGFEFLTGQVFNNWAKHTERSMDSCCYNGIWILKDYILVIYQNKTMTICRYTQYRNIRNDRFFPVLDCFLNFLFFQYSGFLALQGHFLNFSRFSPWFLKFSKKKKPTFFATLLHLLKH